MNPLRLPCPYLDPDGRTHEAECPANLVFQKPLVGKVQFYLPVGEQYESRRRHCSLRQVQDFNSLTYWNCGAIEVDMLQEAVHLARRDALPSLGCHLG